jgi:hypothetical protein
MTISLPHMLPAGQRADRDGCKLWMLSNFGGGPFRARTGDPLIKSQLLYQLS